MYFFQDSDAYPHPAIEHLLYQRVTPNSVSQGTLMLMSSILSIDVNIKLFEFEPENMNFKSKLN